MRHMKIILLSLLTLMSLNSSAQICTPLTEEIPVRAAGRVKPMYVLAKESIHFITGRKKVKEQTPLQTFCEIVEAGKSDKTFELPILIEHIELKDFLGMKSDLKFLMIDDLIAKKDMLRSELFRLKENNSYKKSLNKILNQIMTYESFRKGEGLTIYSDLGNGYDWHAINHLYTLNDTELAQVIKKSKDIYKEKNTDTFLLELKFAKSSIFTYAMLTALIGIFLATLFKQFRYGVAFSLITIAIEIVAMVIRSLISGRAPITNMYETVMFSGFGALSIALIVLIFKRDKIFLISGLGYNILCLFMMKFANGMLDGSISPLVPVLRDNFWLSTHVTTIILSYAALALSWVVANITLVKMRLGKLTKADYRYYQSLTYTCIKVGIVLLSAGIILGGVWADYSWGRFWGWDPKETWSLIVFLFYMAIVHGKSTSWITTHRFMLLSAAGFMTVMMAWFGVNYILASGLHSYGFSEGGALFLACFFAAQTAVIIICIKPRELKA